MLRWPIPDDLPALLQNQQITAVRRRAKFLLLDSEPGTLLIHLGMSGSLRILESPQKPGKHDHVDIEFDSGVIMRYTDPRRFGCFLWQGQQDCTHKLLVNLGPEPLLDEFDGLHLHRQSRGRKAAVKNFIMDNHVVVGVGNIYASEALFMAGINPRRAAGAISRERYQALAQCIKEVLSRAIEVGGTTLRDFTGSSGNPGYFKQSLNVYGRGGLPCKNCGNTLREVRLGQRSSVYCTRCQR